MRPRDEETAFQPDGTQETRRRSSRWFRILNLTGYAVLVLVVFSLVERLKDMQHTNQSLQRNVAIYQTRLVKTNSRTLARLQQVEDRSRKYLDQTTEAIADQSNRSGAEVLTTSKALVRALADREKNARDAINADLRKTRQEILALRMDLKQTETRQAKKERIFQSIQKQWDPSIVLIHSKFTYKGRNEEGDMEEHTGSGWGSGFVVTEEGHIITNKHVVQPWKFDPELCAMEAMGEVEIITKDVEISAWPTGARCMDDAREMITDKGFNNRSLKNLKLLAVAEDHMVKKEISLGGSNLPYTIHALDNNDLAILKCEGARWKPVPCASPVSTPSLEKLDHVMALGFPRGQNGLERGLAETSPSLGTVRKIEDTIHVTASIIPGNSGGPLFDDKGEVVGIATRIYSETLGICIKIRHGLDLLEDTIEKEVARKKAAAFEATKMSKVVSVAERK